jgi:hypothetical protein
MGIPNWCFNAALGVFSILRILLSPTLEIFDNGFAIACRNICVVPISVICKGMKREIKAKSKARGEIRQKLFNSVFFSWQQPYYLRLKNDRIKIQKILVGRTGMKQAFFVRVCFSRYACYINFSFKCKKEASFVPLKYFIMYIFFPFFPFLSFIYLIAIIKGFFLLLLCNRLRAFLLKTLEYSSS